MAYAMFGGGPADITTDSNGSPIGGVQFQVWTRRTGGQRVTDLKDAGGTTLPGVVTSESGGVTTDTGRIWFQAPEQFYALYLDPGYGQRWQVVPSHLAEIVATATEQARTAYTAVEAATPAPDGDSLVRRRPDGSTDLAQVVVTDPPISSSHVITRGYFDARVSDDRLRAAATVDYGTFEGQLYAVTRVRDAFRPGVIGKTLGGGYETSGETGAQLIPPRETLRAAQARTKAAIIANASGWRTSGNVGELRGAQIVDGQLLHGFGNQAESPVGLEAVGFLPDGSYRLYSTLNGDTTDHMLADGVTTSFSYGPIVLRDGSPRELLESTWSYFVTAKSARQILGFNEQTKELILITLTGVSDNSTGITGPQAAALALQEGCRDALLLDSGGSSQTLAGSTYAIPSSDAGGERAIPDFLTINAVVDNLPLVTPWQPIPYLNGFQVHDAAQAWRFNSGRIELYGSAKPASGAITTAGTVIGQLPFKPARSIIGLGASAGPNTVKLVIQPSGDIIVFGNGTNTTYVRLDTVAGPLTI